MLGFWLTLMFSFYLFFFWIGNKTSVIKRKKKKKPKQPWLFLEVEHFSSDTSRCIFTIFFFPFDVSSKFFLYLMLVEGGLQASCRRSLFTLASYMLIFAARAGNLTELIPIFKASSMDRMVGLYNLHWGFKLPFNLFFLKRKILLLL